MAAHNPPVSDEAVRLGHAFKTLRTSNGLSHQDLHTYGKDRGVKIYNSQIAYFERGVLCPQPTFFVALARLMKDLKAGYKTTTGKRTRRNLKGFLFIEKETTRERLEFAVPFVNTDGRPVTATDLFGMFVGQLDVNSLYTVTKEELTKEELTEEFCHEYGHSLSAAFNKIARERMLAPKKAWLELIKVEKFPQDPKYQAICQDILRGAHELTKEEALGIVEEYAPTCGGQCPCFHALCVLADDKEDPVDISDLKKENKRLLEMVG